MLIHAAGAGLLRQTYTPREYIPADAPEPIVLDLQPEAQPSPPPQQFVDVAVPSEAPPQITGAYRRGECRGDGPGPAGGRAARARVGTGRIRRAASAGGATAPPEPEATSPAEESKEEAETEKKEDSKTKEPIRKVEAPAKEVLPEAVEAPPAPKAPEGPIKIAQAQPMPAQRPEKGKTRERGGVSKQGQTNFDAIQSEIAPYLKHVRERVEQQWNQMLYTRYSGTSR